MTVHNGYIAHFLCYNTQRMNEQLSLVLSILVYVTGGLSLFLLGMKQLSEGLQATAGGGLRKFMAYATSNRIVGIGTGVFSTMLVQSSSIITVMLVSFVSTALLTLPQAINVLIGANIGTTATVWIIALTPNKEMLGFVGVGLGGILYFFLRGERVHNFGLMLLGLGLVFLGLVFMSNGVKPINENAEFRAVFTTMSAETFWGVVKIAAVSTLFTAIVQSSAATIAIAMALADEGLITYPVAIAVLFGANIGTTATGWIAAIGGTADAKRTALSHTLSNVLGSILLIPFFYVFFVKVGPWLFPNYAEPEMIKVGGGATVHMARHFTHMMAPIAVTDTVFAVCRGVLLFPFVKPFARLIEKLVKQPENEKPHLSTLTRGVKLSPVIACDQALVEVQFMRDSNLEMLVCARKVLEGVATPEDESHIMHREDILDNVQREVTEFLGQLMVKRLPADVAERSRRLLRLTDELESVSDEAAKVLAVTKRLRKAGQRMSDASRGVMLEVHDRVFAFAEKVSPWVKSPRPAIDLAAVQAESSSIHDLIRECRRTQLGRVGPEDPDSPIRVLVELDIINSYERVRAYYLNIAETLAGGKRV